MLIVHIIIDLQTGGAELMMKRLIESHIGSADYRHRVISLRGLGRVGPAMQAAGIEVEAMGLNGPLGLPRIVLRLSRRIRELRPDIVQTWMYHADLIGGLAARRAGLRHIAWGVRIADISPQMGVSRATTWVRRACAVLSRRIPQRIVYVGNSARAIHERLGYDPAKSVFIPNGYSIPGLPTAEQRARKRIEWELPEDALVIGSAGRFSAQKDQRGFVAAAAQVAAAIPSAYFVMMGRGNDSSNPELNAWIGATGCPEKFRLLGERTDVIECLGALDLFCLHSIGEGFPNVLAEAMSVGRPSVTTTVGDSAELLGDAGLTVPPADPVALAEALTSLASLEEEVREKLGAKGRERIVAEFSMDAIRRRYEQLYDGMRAEN
ncbi:glycosyltransferase [Sphingomonas sp. LY54]|uniref:glycosyltransferase n=1 Tax=Sphingomonas sp. LY54 TaxID=3095343 RepID=UPI002D793D39|nr:glycosyltransferase [Sphingomonas sp. LY54]WRP27594.1 glycosyltransferase [Sphingomonas sp. LY54]